MNKIIIDQNEFNNLQQMKVVLSNFYRRGYRYRIKNYRHKAIILQNLEKINYENDITYFEDMLLPMIIKTKYQHLDFVLCEEDICDRVIMFLQDKLILNICEAGEENEKTNDV